MSMEWFRFFMDWMRVVYTCLFVASAPIVLFDVFFVEVHFSVLSIVLANL